MENRYEAVLLFDVKNGNPNGDPDSGNLPRTDPETGLGLVTDVCIKRKIRNYVAVVEEGVDLNEIYFKEKAVLNAQHKRAYDALDEKSVAKKLPKDAEKAGKLTEFMCETFFDIRTFGAVMTTEVNCGQVRGPVQITFAESIDPVLVSEHTITRGSVTNEKDIEKERTMGSKATLPYGLYRAHIYINANLAKQTGFSEEDLALLWKAVINMFEHDRSAARGEMATQKLIVFKHASALGEAQAHKLFDLVDVKRKDETKPARKFSDYEVIIDRDNVPEGVELIELA